MAPGRLASLRRRRRECGAALAHDLPRRHRLGKARSPSRPRRQIWRASSSRGMSSSRSAPLMVTDSAARKGEQPFDGAVDDADDRRQSGGGSMRKCALTMARNSFGVFRPRHQVSRNGGRHGEDDGVAGRRARRFVVAEIERRDFACRETHSREADARSCNRNVARSQESQAPARQKRSPSPSRAISGRQACRRRANVSRITAPASCAEPSRGSVLSAASSNGATSRS